MPLSSGLILNNRYRIENLLGQGGYGAVYTARDTNLDELVAIKESFGTTPQAQKQFQFEAKLLFRMKHDNLPRVHDYFVVPGQGLYLVMDFIDGVDLETMLEIHGGPLPEDQVLGWIVQICNALSHLHSQRPPVIHRDVKPANIRLTPDGRAILVDLGIAKEYDPRMVTQDAARGVTPGFSPLEQYGSGGTDARTDVYALGATMYNLLTGQYPLEALDRGRGVNLPEPGMVNPKLSQSVQSTVKKALAILPEDRYQSAAELKDAILNRPPQPQLVYKTVTPATTNYNIAPVAPPVSAQPASKIPSAPSPAPAATGYNIASTPVPHAQTVRSTEPPGNRRLWLMGGTGLFAVAAFTLICIFAAMFWMGFRPPNFPAAIQTTENPLQTAELLPTKPQPIETAGVVAPAATDVPIPTETSPPAPTNAPAATRVPPTQWPTNTPPPAPSQPHFILGSNSFCRGGPGIEYDQIWVFLADAELDIVGQNGEWWLIQFEDPGTSHTLCWLSNVSGTISGDTDGVPHSEFTTIK